MTHRLPFDQPDPLAVPPLLRTLQEQGTIHRIRTRVGDDAWLVTGYAEVRSLLDDGRLGRSHPDPSRAARSGESALFGGPLGNHETEKADHRRMRSLLQPHFTPGRMRAFRGRVEALTANLLNELEEHGSPADLNTALALPLPILVICELLGVPYAERTRFREWTQAAADVHDRSRSEQGLGELFAYGQELVARKRRDPGDDVISALCATQGVPDDEIAMLSMALLFAGHETTVVQIGLGALLLLTHHDQWQALLKDPAMIPGVVEEILRMPGKNGGGIPRYAHADIEIGGVTIQVGDLVMLDNGAANHDPSAFPAPDRFDATRTTPPHLSFGHGARYCIGAPLARMELQVAFSQLVLRFPQMRLAVPVEELRLRADILTGGLDALPVTW
ncbi:cytochrome P450 [Streptomyces sp. TRM70350]|uniref:cytochrome P450 n=1 Tax=Streptomyces sp. TRM70350 TaxID=2856165 RepID=UPI001C48C5DD|nr:cytochrome P450 [Streptomyces sp. TRM70350]MBV7700563.1 cytochrome P450 [Streptomyces sp. TRM70350]